MQPDNPAQCSVPLYGLVIAGGESSRMGEDKGGLNYHGKPQAVFLWEILAEVCRCAFVSVRSAQTNKAPYDDLPVVIDAGPSFGPASALLAARQTRPEAAWLAVAVDLPRLERRTLEALIHARSERAAATLFRHPDGTLEPLCAIWEPAALALLVERVASGDASPRRCLEAADVEVAECPDQNTIRGVDTQAERAALLIER